MRSLSRGLIFRLGVMCCMSVGGFGVRVRGGLGVLGGLWVSFGNKYIYVFVWFKNYNYFVYALSITLLMSIICNTNIKQNQLVIVMFLWPIIISIILSIFDLPVFTVYFLINLSLIYRLSLISLFSLTFIFIFMLYYCWIFNNCKLGLLISLSFS